MDCSYLIDVASETTLVLPYLNDDGLDPFIRFAGFNGQTADVLWAVDYSIDYYIKAIDMYHDASSVGGDSFTFHACGDAPATHKNMRLISFTMQND